MDLVATCKDKLTYFRIKELKDVLTQLGLSKQGKKQDLVDRILSTLSDDQVSKFWAKRSVGKEEVAKLVDGIYRKMQVSGANDLASKGQVASECSNLKIKAETDNPSLSDTKVRCPCGDSLDKESVIMCEDPKCQVWQHVGCVLIPEKPMDGDPPFPKLFYCELCRLSRADPFWISVGHPLYPVKLTPASIPTDGTNPVQSVERTFQLTRSDKDLLTKAEYDVQAWCMLLNDKVPFRMQWPQYADLQVNGSSVRPVNRPGSQLLGANGRDDGPIITTWMKDGINKISLTGYDARIFCLGVRIVKRRTVQQILSLIPKESDGERFEDALSRVCRCVGGGAEEADSDSDLEVVADSIAVSLRCPMSGSRMKVAGRFKPCIHMGCFDLDVFVEMNQRSRKWQCPICLKNYSLEHIIIDRYFNRVTSMLRHCGEDVTEIEVKPDGSWRVKSKTESERRELGDLVQWHSPDGSLSVLPEDKLQPKAEFKQIKQEGASDGHPGLKLGIKKNRNGIWEVSKPDDMNTSSSNQLYDKFGDHEPKVIPMSSSATGSGREGEDPSVNQDGGGNFDFSAHGIELDSTPANGGSTFAFTDPNPSVPVGDAEIIVLSDSEEENDIFISSRGIYENNQTEPGAINFTMHPGISDAFDDPAVGTNGFFNSNEDLMPMWPIPPGSQGGPGFQLFTSDPDVSDLVDLQPGPMNCTNPMNGYTLVPETTIGSAVQPAFMQDSAVGRSDTGINGNLVDNPLAIGRDDPSLQLFLPPSPSGAQLQTDVRDQNDTSNVMHADDWISLRLGGDATVGNCDTPSANGFNQRQQISSGDGCMDTLADTASLLLGMNDTRSEKVSRQRSEDSPFSFPRQKRSVRPRMYLSIDSDSD